MGKQRKRNKNVEGSVVGMQCMGAVIRRVLLLHPLFLMLVYVFGTRFPHQSTLSLFDDDKFGFGGHEIQGLRVANHGLNVSSPLLNESVNGHGVVALTRERPTTHVEISSQEKFENGSSEWAITGNKKSNAKNATFSLDAVKMQMEAFRSASMPAGMKDPSQKQCKGRQIYVYDLPKRFNAELVEQCHTLIPWLSLCDYLSNEGMGKPIEKFYKHWFQAHQYALELIFHSRISRHPCLVSDPAEANLFYIPYNGGLDVMRWNFRENISPAKRDELALELVKWLQGQPWWRRHGGRDHALVLGKISWDFRRSRDDDQWGNRLLHLPEMKSVTKLLIERHPWDMNEIGVPHPTFFHPRSDEDIWQWQWQIRTSQRPHLISFAGAPRPNSTKAIRSVLTEQCLSRPQSCNFLNCNSRVCLGPENTVKLFMQSELCLQPPGDSPTRRSLFDSLIVGCIPVLFNPFTAYYHYPWHLPANENSYSVYIREETVEEKKINVREVLQKIPEEQRKEMRKTIIQEIMPALVYGDTDSRFKVFQDAFMISLNNILWKTTNPSKDEAF
eukprot:PITA_12871